MPHPWKYQSQAGWDPKLSSVSLLHPTKRFPFFLFKIEMFSVCSDTTRLLVYKQPYRSARFTPSVTVMSTASSSGALKNKNNLPGTIQKLFA